MKKLFISETADLLGQEFIMQLLQLTDSIQSYELASSDKVSFVVHNQLVDIGLNQGNNVDFILLAADDFLKEVLRAKKSEVVLVISKQNTSFDIINELFESSDLNISIIDLELLPPLNPSSLMTSKTKKVRSIQRMIRPPASSVKCLSEEYFSWLTKFSSEIVQIKKENDLYFFCLFHPSLKILVLKRNVSLSSDDAEVLNIVGGLLAARDQREARFEFREISNRQYLLTILYDFRPALPWSFYLISQAIIHYIVMYLFSEHLKWIFISKKGTGYENSSNRC